MLKPEFMNVKQAWLSDIRFDTAYSLIGGLETVPVELSENPQDVIESDTYQKAVQRRLNSIPVEYSVDEVLYSVAGVESSRYYIRHPFHRSIMKYRLNQSIGTEVSIIHLIRQSVADTYEAPVILQKSLGIRSDDNIDYLLRAGGDIFLYGEYADSILSTVDCDVLNVVTEKTDCDVRAVNSKVNVCTANEIVPNHVFEQL